ncbi:hypothetical protein SS1G_10813 [Sclerotinia sclerotiorum 1980 UF-70]|uniref:MICOS complex subunit MIC12 n=2 Tax=Sclerotinia sclerotiorum (strain ATCC 18683 / 1980 / Ss-1) TaxID=665079 RepID=A7EZP6_SCLS1|nr:hypothetical protein SS1G_10813 [Sclerotinia sclerotiorum 1980 UF-70]APA12202.1 hypothetical protein sscle_09g069720 [Sclerotinia sclerotiorum 1980 UF-70]EDN94938.1 hypothetical protein SS1G_10813 [Sclerotinia sclerotiorum 1980 UF-70]
MGFTTGFTGGVTLTLSLAYLTVLAHQRNRASQSLHLHQQSYILTSILEKQPIPPPKTRAELAREERSTLIEAAKDRWNAEIENGVRWVQRTDWEGVRDGIEGAVSRALGLGLERGREGIEKGEEVAGEKLRDFREEAREEARRAATGAVAGVERSVAGTRGAIDASSQKLKEAEAKIPSYSEIERKAGGTVDTARESVRNAVSRGIEAGKDIAQKAGAAVGITEQKTASSDVERALRERFEGPTHLDKSVQQALEERYTPIDQRDNSTLRGL